MKEKQLFPCDTTHLARMMLREDDGDLLYVIQSEYNKRTKMFENELIENYRKLAGENKDLKARLLYERTKNDANVL